LVGEATAVLRRSSPALAPLAGEWLSGPPRIVTCTVQALLATAHVCETLLSPAAHPSLLHHALAGLFLAFLLESERGRASCALAQSNLDLARAVANTIRVEPDAPWRTASIARRLGLSTSTLRRKLRSQRTSVRAILLEERLQLAAALLADGRLRVSEVSARCGYTSASKFTRRFVARFGQPPGKRAKASQ
jgi:AraC-like DNA-binding protein